MTESFGCLNGRQILGGTRGRGLGVVPPSSLATGRGGCTLNSNVAPPPERFNDEPPPPFGANRGENIEQNGETPVESYPGDKRFSKSGKKDDTSKLAPFGSGGGFRSSSGYSKDNFRSDSNRPTNPPLGARGGHGFGQSATGGGNSGGFTSGGSEFGSDGRGGFRGDSNVAPNNSANAPFGSGTRGGIGQSAAGGDASGGFNGGDRGSFRRDSSTSHPRDSAAPAFGSRGGRAFGQQQQGVGGGGGFAANTESRDDSRPFGASRGGRGGFTSGTEPRDDSRPFGPGRGGRGGFGHSDSNNRSDNTAAAPAFGSRGGRAFGQQGGGGGFAANTESRDDSRPFGASRGGRGGFTAGTEPRDDSRPFGASRGGRGGFTTGTEPRDDSRPFGASRGGRGGFGHSDLNNRRDDSAAAPGAGGGRAFGQQGGDSRGGFTSVTESRDGSRSFGVGRGGRGGFTAGSESRDDSRSFGAGRGGRGGFGHSDSNNRRDDSAAAFSDRGDVGGFRRNSDTTDQRRDSSAGDRREYEQQKPAGGFGVRMSLQTDAEVNSPFPTSTSYVLADCKVEELFEADRRNAVKYRAVADDDEDINVGDSHKEMSTAGRQANVCAIDSWKDAKFHPIIAANIEKSSYDRPRKIQSYAIPAILDGFDVRVHAETGSGKTVAFMAPIIDKLIKAKLTDTTEEPRAEKLGQPHPKALVIEPARELCLQVYGQGLKLASGSGIAVAYAYGEYPYFDNYCQLQKGCDVLCATPGRLITLLTGPFRVDLSQLKYFVLDEADRLLDGSFIPQLRKIILSSQFPTKENRQTMLLSATFPEEVQRLANDVLHNDIFLSLKNRSTVAANSRIVQNFFEVQSSQKKEFLMEILRGTTTLQVPTNVKRTLVFVNSKRSADLLAIYLSQAGLKATTINADRSQKQRELALKMFHDNDIRILVSTDVCARGIDVNEMDHVINYDLPNDPVTYVHRIGRTGRLCGGFSTSFIDPTYDRDVIPDLVKIIREAGQDPPEFMKSVHGLYHPRADDQVSLLNRPSACGFVTSSGAIPSAPKRLPTIPDVDAEPDDTWGECQ